jgi:hypothetical protein
MMPKPNPFEALSAVPHVMRTLNTKMNTTAAERLDPATQKIADKQDSKKRGRNVVKPT